MGRGEGGGGVADSNGPPKYMLMYFKLSYVCPKHGDLGRTNWRP